MPYVGLGPTSNMYVHRTHAHMKSKQGLGGPGFNFYHRVGKKQQNNNLVNEFKGESKPNHCSFQNS